MSELLEKYINEHKDEWYAQGRTEGTTYEAKKIARKMIQMNMFSDDEIAQVTGLSIGTVKALKCG